MTPGTNRRRSVFGAVDLASGRLLYQITRKAASATFIGFMEHVLAGYPNAALVMLMLDDVTIHRSKKVQAWLRTQPRMRLVWGACYSPHDNPVERIWGGLKAALASSPTLTIAGRLGQVHAFFQTRSPAQLLATAAPPSSPWLPEGYGQNHRQAA